MYGWEEGRGEELLFFLTELAFLEPFTWWWWWGGMAARVSHLYANGHSTCFFPCQRRPILFKNKQDRHPPLGVDHRSCRGHCGGSRPAVAMVILQTALGPGMSQSAHPGP